MATIYKKHENWSSRLTFLLAAVGAAVGLGNIWKFPFIAGQNGGGAFVLVYLLAVLFVALPILIAEIALGRWGRQSPPNAMANVAQSQGHSRSWSIVGWQKLSTQLTCMNGSCATGPHGGNQSAPSSGTALVSTNTAPRSSTGPTPTQTGGGNAGSFEPACLSGRLAKVSASGSVRPSSRVVE